MMRHMFEKFDGFLNALRIESKEQGLVSLVPNGCQRKYINEIQKGASEGVRNFIILKGRQQGISTISLALDLYWSFRYSGLQASVVTDTDDNKAYFRSILRNYIENLPSAWRQRVLSFNRTEAAFGNRSRILFQVAGVRSANGNLGRGKGVNYLHATECSSWADQEGLASLTASLAENYPNRLYVFESTARGFNMFHQMYQDAKQAVTRRAIFIPWWLKEDYQKLPGSPEYSAYAGEPTAEEYEWIGMVKGMYDHDITPEQLAWWRWKLAEEITDDILMFQEFPPTEEHAFVMTGSQFFPLGAMNDSLKVAQASTPDEYQYRFGSEVNETSLVRVDEGEGMLRVWEYPKEGEVYVVGADPASGASENSDFFSAQVFRCYGDAIEQVAEFQFRNMAVHQFAWVITHLAGAYHARLNLELNGPGMSVFQEMQRLQGVALYAATQGKNDLMNVVNSIRYYLYMRPDALGAISNSAHTMTTHRLKTLYMQGFRSLFERGCITIRSTELLDEMRTVRSEADGFIGSSNHDHDDLVIAAALGVLTWSQFEQNTLMSSGYTRSMAKAAANRTVDAETGVLQAAVNRFIRTIH